MTQPESTQPPLLARRVGPLPVWVWFLILVLALAGFIWWRRRKAAMEDGGSEQSSLAVGTPGGVLTSDQPTLVPFFPNELVVRIDRDEDDQDDPVTPRPPTPPTTPPRDRPPAKAPPTPTIPKPPTPTKPVKEAGKYITVRQRVGDGPWNSTIYGIWEHLAKRSPTFRTTAKNWQEIWNHEKNAALRKLRGKPENIRKDDKVWVPGRSI